MAQTWKRLFGPAQLTAAAATKYTAPAAGAIIRHVRFYNADTSARTVTFSVGSDAAGTRTHDARSIPAGGEVDWYPILPLTNAEIIQAFADVTLKVTLTINGLDLT
jgi:hypothetical protein